VNKSPSVQLLTEIRDLLQQLVAEVREAKALAGLLTWTAPVNGETTNATTLVAEPGWTLTPDLSKVPPVVAEAERAVKIAEERWPSEFGAPDDPITVQEYENIADALRDAEANEGYLVSYEPKRKLYFARRLDETLFLESFGTVDGKRYQWREEQPVKPKAVELKAIIAKTYIDPDDARDAARKLGYTVSSNFAHGNSERFRLERKLGTYRWAQVS
jgi:hypothetical protein